MTSNTNVLDSTDGHSVKNGLLHNTLNSFFDMEGLLDDALTESMTHSAQVQQANSTTCDAKTTHNRTNAANRASHDSNVDVDSILMQRMARPFASRSRGQKVNY